MGRFLETLSKPSPFHDVEKTESGLLLSGRGDEFNDIVRSAIEKSGDDYVALPITDGHTGYERCLIIPI